MSHGWFGRQWGAGGPAPVCEDPAERVETPVGELCIWCEEPIEAGDSGVVNVARQITHVECHLRSVLGGVNHIEGRCLCCGGSQDPDPPGLTRREAGIAAVAALERKTGEAILPTRHT